MRFHKKISTHNAICRKLKKNVYKKYIYNSPQRVAAAATSLDQREKIPLTTL